MEQLPELRCCQASSSSNAAALQRVLLSYEHALQLLVAQASLSICLPDCLSVFLTHCMCDCLAVYLSTLPSFSLSLSLCLQVRQLQENATQLRTIYAGERAAAILDQEQEVLDAWKQLLSCCEASHVQVTSATDKLQFFSVVRENLMWMEGIMGQIGWDEPR